MEIEEYHQYQRKQFLKNQTELRDIQVVLLCIQEHTLIQIKYRH